MFFFGMFFLLRRDDVHLDVKRSISTIIQGVTLCA
jgi:hypothetical protein